MSDFMPIEEWEAQMSRLADAIKKMKEAGY
jgi:hypothetical protein